MGVFQDETFSDVLKLALAAGILSRMTPHTFLGQMLVVFLTHTAHYDFMNPTTTRLAKEDGMYLVLDADALWMLGQDAGILKWYY